MLLLTDKAPKEAQASYKQFYEELFNLYNYSEVFEIKDVNEYIVKTTNND